MEGIGLLAALEAFLPRGRGALVSLVGAGGKTSLMWSVATEAAVRGLSVLVTTTTRVWDPRDEGRSFGRFLEGDTGIEEASRCAAPNVERAGTSGAALIDVLCAGVIHVAEDDGILPAADGSPCRERLARKLLGVSPSSPALCRASYDLVLVEADGSRGLPIKAPSEAEPVLAEGSDLVLGVVGLDALGRPALEDSVHRLGNFLALTGLARGEMIGEEAIVSLALSPEGFFKGSPERARKVVILSKADLTGEGRAIALARRLTEASAVPALAAASRARAFDAALAVARGRVLYSSVPGA